ncbi:MAG: polynucleotide adenylyltransferase PcnB [Lautropia sp.]|nr:polynucleotide adenylyltransferase PcnB [Lautropia sp.]
MFDRLINWMFGRPARKSSAAGKRRPPLDAHIEVRTHPARSLGISHKEISSAAMRTCEGLHKAGHAAYIVGGGVRDLLLGLPPKDFDVATDAPPEVVQSLFRRARIIGRRFRIVHVMFGRETIEVTTFRAAQENAQTDEHGRMLNDNVFGTRDEDASRRDFTVNALYYDPIAEELIDPLGGVEDLRERILRMIGDPETRYREDPVRMLRTVRFAAKLDFDVDPPTLEPIRQLAPLLENVPTARLFDEILKLLESGHGLACIRRLREEGLHHGVLPLLDLLFETDEAFITEALTRTDARVRRGKSVSPSFLFAALLWPQVRVRWRKIMARGEHQYPALHSAIDSVLDEQANKLALQRRYQADMREIWVMQPRLEKRGRSAHGLLSHLRFRAGYDFLLLRCAAGEIDAALGQWWTDFIEADGQGRDHLVQNLGLTDQKSRKRRRRGPKKQAALLAATGVGTDADAGATAVANAGAGAAAARPGAGAVARIDTLTGTGADDDVACDAQKDVVDRDTDDGNDGPQTGAGDESRSEAPVAHTKSRRRPRRPARRRPPADAAVAASTGPSTEAGDEAARTHDAAPPGDSTDHRNDGHHRRRNGTGDRDPDHEQRHAPSDRAPKRGHRLDDPWKHPTDDTA